MKFPILNPKLKRIFVIVLAGLGVLMLVLLAASLQSVELKPAKVFFTDDGNRPNVFSGFNDFVDNVGSLTLGEALMLVGGFLVLFVLMLAMLSPEARKRMIKTILRVGLTAWVIYYAITKFRPEGIFEVDPQVAGMEQAPEVVVTPPPYTPPVVPSWLIYVVSLMVVLFFAGFGFWLYRFLRPPKHQLQNLARAARSALKDLSAGRDWDDTVIQCYVRMSDALGQERGLHRQQGMTPQEFASRLEQAGLPSDPVRRLTRLFEKARYGGRKSSREDVNEAVTCLTAILHAVGAQA
ncbi:MAG: DUF4129 domain-containing protein [Anaerolineales bacterium]|nr:DUF4129 domain-containing protein [Anaerolineales bacterium]